LSPVSQSSATTAHSCTTQQIDALPDAAVHRLYHDSIRAYADSHPPCSGTVSLKCGCCIPGKLLGLRLMRVTAILRHEPTSLHHRIRGKNDARTSTKPLCESSKRLLRSTKPSRQSSRTSRTLLEVLFRCAHDPGLRLTHYSNTLHRSLSSARSCSLCTCPHCTQRIESAGRIVPQAWQRTGSGLSFDWL
jgi:hypothetical protein